MDHGTKLWCNGEIIPWEQGWKIHVMNLCLHYGLPPFEGIPYYRTASGRRVVFRLIDHLARLYDSAVFIGIRIPYVIEELVEAIKELIRRDIFEEGYIRPIVTFGDQMAGLHTPLSTLPVSVSIGLFRWESPEKTAIYAELSPWRRIDETTTSPKRKLAGNYLNSVLAHQHAAREGFDDAILLDRDGYLAEASGANLFLYAGGRWLTPPLSAPILAGITRNTILTIMRDNQGADYRCPVVEIPIKPEIILSCEEMFLCGTAVEVLPVTAVGLHSGSVIKIGNGFPGPMTRQIMNSYDDVVHGRTPQYIERWLTFVD